MRPARWRRSTHLLIGVIVLAAVVIVVALALVLADGGATRSARAVAGTPSPPTAKPAVVPVADSAAKPTLTGLAAAVRQPHSPRGAGPPLPPARKARVRPGRRHRR